MSGSARTHLVIERDGQLWAVPGAAVDRLSRGDGRVAVRLRAPDGGAPGAAEGDANGGGNGGGELAADRLLAVAGELAVVPVPAALARFWDEPAAGLALFDRRPVVVIDPARPPRVLTAGNGAAGAGESLEEADG